MAYDPSKIQAYKSSAQFEQKDKTKETVVKLSGDEAKEAAKNLQVGKEYVPFGTSNKSPKKSVFDFKCCHELHAKQLEKENKSLHELVASLKEQIAILKERR